jgi:diacylglycerol kinase family enzyme
MSESRTTTSRPNPKRFKVSFVINPASGGGWGERIAKDLPEIMASFEFAQDDWTIAYLKRDMDPELIPDLYSRSTRMICVGGDGTMSYALGIAARAGKRGAKLGLIPLGTGNDLSRAMNVFANFQDKGLISTLRKLIVAPHRPFDLWSVNGTVTMAAYVSAGLDARVACLFHRDREEGKIPVKAAWMNKLWYVICFWRARSHHLAPGSYLRYVDAKGNERSLGLSGRRMVLIGNAGSYAGGAHPFERCDFADGLLEIVAVGHFYQFALAILTALPERHLRQWIARRFLTTLQARSATLFVPNQEFVQVDGEDLSSQLAGSELEIRHAGRAEILVLEN